MFRINHLSKCPVLLILTGVWGTSGAMIDDCRKIMVVHYLGRPLIILFTALIFRLHEQKLTQFMLMLSRKKSTECSCRPLSWQHVGVKQKTEGHHSSLETSFSLLLQLQPQTETTNFKCLICCSE